MLQSNSNQARANLRAYITYNFNPEGYTDTPPTEFADVAKFILNVFRGEKAPVGTYADVPESLRFADWCAGLPSVFYAGYFLHSAVDNLGLILEENEAEKAKYSETDAEKYLTSLIYRELVRAETMGNTKSLADKNCPLYTKEHDGTIQRWYLFAWYGPRFAVATVKNAKMSDYKRYYHMNEVGERIFLTRKEANAAPNPPIYSERGEA